MAEAVILAILGALGIGQVVACRRGSLAGAIYFVSVAPLDYFSTWAFGTWGPYRLCAVILIAWPLLMRRGGRDGQKLTQHPIAAFWAYGAVVTLIGAIFWPYDAMRMAHIVHSFLRPFIQLLQFTIEIGAVWRVATALCKPGAFEIARRRWLWVAVPLCGYAMYQIVAWNSGLPVTGVRRPAAGVTVSTGGEEQGGAYRLEGDVVRRACSVMGEPKALGALCVFWLYLIGSEFASGRPSRAAWISGPAVAVALWLTASTSAWAGALVCVFLCSLAATRLGR